VIGLLYAHNRLALSRETTETLDESVKTTLRAFFWNWITNHENQIIDGNGNVSLYNWRV